MESCPHSRLQCMSYRGKHINNSETAHRASGAFCAPPQEKRVEPSEHALSAQVSLPAAALELCQQNPKGNPPPPPQSPSLPRQDPLPLIPTSRPSVLACVPLHFLIYDLISTQHTVKVCERPFVHALWSHCPPPPSGFTLLSLRSIFNLYSHLGAAQRKRRPEIHLSQISTNLLLILPADGLALIPHNFSPSSHAADLSRLQLRRKSRLDVCLTVGVQLSLTLS